MKSICGHWTLSTSLEVPTANSIVANTLRCLGSPSNQKQSSWTLIIGWAVSRDQELLPNERLLFGYVGGVGASPSAKCWPKKAAGVPGAEVSGGFRPVLLQSPCLFCSNQRDETFIRRQCWNRKLLNQSWWRFPQSKTDFGTKICLLLEQSCHRRFSANSVGPAHSFVRKMKVKDAELVVFI